jgi:D-proline reductase (dithiol) PrdB
VCPAPNVSSAPDTVDRMSADASIRERVADLPHPTIEAVAVDLDKPLSECRVAIVTTAGLRPNGDVELWSPDPRFTVLPGDAHDVQLSHFSPNFDRTGIIEDLNVVYPIDRLAELADAGVIGSVNDRHISFMGAQMDATFSAIINDTAPAAAKILVDDGVDVVLLTPV